MSLRRAESKIKKRGSIQYADLPAVLPRGDLRNPVAINIDGINTLACIYGMDEVKGDGEIYPLPHMPVVKDADPGNLTHFMQQQDASHQKPWLETQQKRQGPNMNGKQVD